MLLDEKILELESINPREILTFEKRLEALETALGELTHRLETQLFGQIRHVEEAILERADQTRIELNRKSANRLEQFSKLATKLSRHLDELNVAQPPQNTD